MNGMLLSRLPIGLTKLGQPMLGRGFSMIKGRATAEATKEFVDKSNLKLFHKLYRSQLSINPIIHGSPRHYESTDQAYMDALTKRAVTHNRSNCVVVYDHRKGKAWNLTNLDAIICPEEGIKREHLVLCANLGVMASPHDMYKRMSEACKKTNLEYIDMVFFEVTDEVLKKHPRMLTETTQSMEELVSNGNIQSLGIKLSLSPYIYHTPPLHRGQGPNFFMPLSLEDELRQNDLIDLILYNISPTTAAPATHPMLSATEEDGKEDTSEAERTFTRVACDPLICIRGSGKVLTSEQEMIDSAEPHSNPTPEITDGSRELALVSDILEPQLEAAMAEALDQLCPLLKSTPRLQEKALRVVFSVGVDAMLMDTEVSALSGKLALEPKDMVSAHDTEDVFGSFAMPEEILKNRAGI